MKQKQSTFKFFLSLCPYVAVWQAIKLAIKERKLPSSARQGAFIALLGLFCPLFWIAFFTGASDKELIFHATHSGIFIVTGLVLMIIGFIKSS